MSESKKHELYFAGGVINQHGELGGGKWIRLGENIKKTIFEEYNRFVESRDIVTFIICGGEYFVIIKENENIYMWKLNSLYARQVMLVSKEEADKIGYSAEIIKEKSISLEEQIVKKDTFSRYYQINIKIM